MKVSHSNWLVHALADWQEIEEPPRVLPDRLASKNVAILWKMVEPPKVLSDRSAS